MSGDGKKEPTVGGQLRPAYRLLALSLVAGMLGAVAALGFDVLVDLAQRGLLTGIGGYDPPGVGTLVPESHTPLGWARWWLPVATTLGGLLSGWLVYRWAPEAEGHGTDAAIEAYHQLGGQVRRRIPLIKAVASALTIGSGGVAGREGPTAQISVGLGTMLAERVGLRRGERRTLLLASMAAGLAAMFRAPLGMAIFAVEILYSGMVLESEALVYTLVAAVTSYATFGIFRGWDRLFEIPPYLRFDNPADLVAFAALGLVAGLLGAILPTLLYRTRDLFHRLPGPPHLRPAVGGFVVGLLAIAAPQVLGTGYGWVELAMAGQLGLASCVTLLLLKGPAMAVTIGSGGSGGVFAPTVTLGAMLGATVGILAQGIVPGGAAPAAAFVVVGMAAVFAAAARTPISTLIMVVEMTGGYGLIVPAMLANVVAYVVQRSLTQGAAYPTLYRSQVERREDSPLHRGVLVQRAIDLIESGPVELSEFRLPRLLNLLRFGEPIRLGDGDGMLVAVRIEGGSPLAGSRIAETLGHTRDVTAVAVLRGNEVLVPRGHTELLPDDDLLALARETSWAELRRLAAHEG